jgi:RND family efflux transporter MFP subunit
MKSLLKRVRWSVALCGLLLLACSRSGSRTAEPVPVRPVTVVPVETRPMEHVVTAVGSLAAQEQATLSIKVSGRLHIIAVDLGSIVKKDDLLAQVDPQDYELRVKQAAAALAQSRAMLGLPLGGTNDAVEIENTSIVKQAGALLSEAEKNRERILNLSRSGISSQAEVDTTEAAYRVALNRYEATLEEARTRHATLAQRRAELEIAQKQLSDTALRAPFDGAIQARTAGLGEYLAAGTPVVTLVRTDPLRLHLEVPEREAPGIRTGQLVRVHVEGETNSCTGRIARLSPAISDQNRMLIVEADIPNDGSLRLGVFVRGDIVTRERDEGLCVPSSALVTFAGLEKVIVVRADKALEKTVMTGRRGADWVEIRSGLSPGERVIVTPGNLRTGQPVTITDLSALETSRTTSSSAPGAQESILQRGPARD